MIVFFSYDKNLILEYLSLPKQNNVFDQKLTKAGNEANSVDLSWVAEEIPELTPICDDEPYIRRALSDFFLVSLFNSFFLHSHKYYISFYDNAGKIGLFDRLLFDSFLAKNGLK